MKNLIYLKNGKLVVTGFEELYHHKLIAVQYMESGMLSIIPCNKLDDTEAAFFLGVDDLGFCDCLNLYLNSRKTKAIEFHLRGNRYICTEIVSPKEQEKLIADNKMSLKDIIGHNTSNMRVIIYSL